jgi:hypothetical protein
LIVASFFWKRPSRFQGAAPGSFLSPPPTAYSSIQRGRFVSLVRSTFREFAHNSLDDPLLHRASDRRCSASSRMLRPDAATAFREYWDLLRLDRRSRRSARSLLAWVSRHTPYLEPAHYGARHRRVSRDFALAARLCALFTRGSSRPASGDTPHGGFHRRPLAKRSRSTRRS